MLAGRICPLYTLLNVAYPDDKEARERKHSPRFGGYPTVNNNKNSAAYPAVNNNKNSAA